MKELKAGLVRIYGDRLKAVYFPMRGDYRPGSDVDVMILLKDYKNYWNEQKKISQLASDVSLEYDLLVSRIFMTEAKWQKPDTPLLRNIHQDGQSA